MLAIVIAAIVIGRWLLTYMRRLIAGRVSLGIEYDLRDRTRRSVTHALARAGDDIAHQRARARSLSPLATLQRGYAVVQRSDGRVVRDPHDVGAGDALRVRVAGGELAAHAD